MRLEQGRSSQPSVQLLGAPARALRLSETRERLELLRVLGVEEFPTGAAGTPGR